MLYQRSCLARILFQAPPPPSGEAVKAHPMIQSTIRERTLHVGRELQKAYNKGMLKLNKVLSADSALGHVTKTPKLLGFDDPKMLELMHLYEDIDIDHEGGNVYFLLAATNHHMDLFQGSSSVGVCGNSGSRRRGEGRGII